MASASVMLLLALALVGMHQLVALADGPGHAHGAAVLGAEVHAGCHHEAVGAQLDCLTVGDSCVAVVSDSWVDVEPPRGLPSMLPECAGVLTAGRGSREVDRPPDATWLSVWRT